MNKLLFLGYNREKTRIIDFIAASGWSVAVTNDKVSDLSAYDLVISFGFRHILNPEALATARRPVINLHISYLPWNRGAHPVFWAAYENTPMGVTIHEIDAGVDTGPLCFQRRIFIDGNTETFESAHKLHFLEIEGLFEQHAAALLSGSYESRRQQGTGSVRRVRDLPRGFSWSELIAPTVARLKGAT